MKKTIADLIGQDYKKSYLKMIENSPFARKTASVGCDAGMCDDKGHQHVLSEIEKAEKEAIENLERIHALEESLTDSEVELDDMPEDMTTGTHDISDAKVVETPDHKQYVVDNGQATLATEVHASNEIIDILVKASSVLDNLGVETVSTSVLKVAIAVKKNVDKKEQLAKEKAKEEKEAAAEKKKEEKEKLLAKKEKEDAKAKKAKEMAAVKAKKEKEDAKKAKTKKADSDMWSDLMVIEAAAKKPLPAFLKKKEEKCKECDEKMSECECKPVKKTVKKKAAASIHFQDFINKYFQQYAKLVDGSSNVLSGTIYLGFTAPDGKLPDQTFKAICAQATSQKAQMQQEVVNEEPVKHLVLTHKDSNPENTVTIF